MSALQRQTYANTVDPLFVKTSGNSVVEGAITAELFVTDGPVASQGIRLKNEQYISFTDEPASPVVEALRIYAAETGTPGITFAELAVPSTTSGLYFSAIGANSSTLFRPNYPANDLLQVDGKIVSQELALNNQSCSTGTIPIGATNVVIPSTRVTATSKIFLTFFGSPSAGPGKGVSQGNLIVNQALIVPGTSFRVDLTDADGVSVAASAVDVTFHWFLVN
jgi:hypothetical protein